MKLSNSDLKEIMLKFSQSFIEQYKNTHGHLPTNEVDEQWPSPCEQGTYNENEILWQPVEVVEPLTFENIESALELKLHHDIKIYFTSIYSDSLNAQCSEGQLSLLFPWSIDDFKRLQENIIGHIMMKQQLKQSITLFFAVTDDEENILSVNNENGEVWVERIGCEPHKKLANSLVEFFKLLTPSVELIKETN